MTGPSLLWPSGSAETTSKTAPAFFRDLNIDQIVASTLAGKAEYDLQEFFNQPLGALHAIEYRQAVMQDVQQGRLLHPIKLFAAAMHEVRETLAQGAKLYYTYQKEAWLLDAASVYCASVRKLETDLRSANPLSEAFIEFRAFLTQYIDSQQFRTLVRDVENVSKDLDAIRYTLRIGPGWITVAPYEDQADYEREIEDDFSRFKQGDVEKFRFKFNDYVQMNHIESGVLDRIAKLFPEPFNALDAFGRNHDGFADPIVARFDREAQFYVAYHDQMARLTAKGLKFCFPKVVTNKSALHAAGTFDLALANMLATKDGEIVTNDFHLEGQERILIVSGPNQGGKTTFARTFGQLHFLAALGLPVPGESAQLFLFDQIFTHFETQEDLHNLRGKLHDDLFRLHQTLSAASANSIVILNEVFNSTSLKDAIFLSSEILKAILALDALCVCVTFIDELATLSPKIVSMASTVRPDNPAERTFNIVRKPPDGLAYALSVAEKHGLTYKQLQERLSP